MAGDTGKSHWHTAAFRIISGTATHPLEYAKFLIQIGHEPIAPNPTTTLTGKPALGLPNVFQYLNHIKNKDGVAGLYRGLGLKLVSQCVTIYAETCTQEVLKTHGIFRNEVIEGSVDDGDAEDSESEEDEEELMYDEAIPMSERHKRFLRHLGTKLTCRSIAIFASHPFHLAAMRTMAQFIGRETKYTGIMGSIVTVYRENGISGFWHGFVPRLIGEVGVITIGTSLTFVARSYFIKDRSLAGMVSTIMSYIASALTYPFHVVTSCMAIRGSSLKAAHPSYMPGSYTTWVGCWRFLYAENQIQRGSSVLWRYYTGPQVIIGGRPIPLEPFKTY
jgi:carrier protein